MQSTGPSPTTRQTYGCASGAGAPLAPAAETGAVALTVSPGTRLSVSSEPHPHPHPQPQPQPQPQRAGRELADALQAPASRQAPCNPTAFGPHVPQVPPPPPEDPVPQPSPPATLRARVVTRPRARLVAALRAAAGRPALLDEWGFLCVQGSSAGQESAHRAEQLLGPVCIGGVKLFVTALVPAWGKDKTSPGKGRDPIDGKARPASSGTPMLALVRTDAEVELLKEVGFTPSATEEGLEYRLPPALLAQWRLLASQLPGSPDLPHPRRAVEPDPLREWEPPDASPREYLEATASARAELRAGTATESARLAVRGVPGWISRRSSCEWLETSYAGMRVVPWEGGCAVAIAGFEQDRQLGPAVRIRASETVGALERGGCRRASRTPGVLEYVVPPALMLITDFFKLAAEEDALAQGEEERASPPARRRLVLEPAAAATTTDLPLAAPEGSAPPGTPRQAVIGADSLFRTPRKRPSRRVSAPGTGRSASGRPPDSRRSDRKAEPARRRRDDIPGPDTPHTSRAERLRASSVDDRPRWLRSRLPDTPYASKGSGGKP